MDPTGVSPTPSKPGEKRASESPPATRAKGVASGRAVSVAGGEARILSPASQQPPVRAGKSGRARRTAREGGEASALSSKALKKEQTRLRLESSKPARASAPTMSRADMEKDVLAQVRCEFAGRSHEVPATRPGEFTDEARTRLGELGVQHPGLIPMLELAEARNLTITGKGPGDISLHLGPMAYPLDCGEDTERQIGQLQTLLSGFRGGHVIVGWCPGNVNQSKPGLLVGTLREHERVLAESKLPDRARLTVHSAAYQSQWNPDVVSSHLEGLKRGPGDSRDAIGGKKVFDEARKRFLDAKRYEAQSSLVLPELAGVAPTSGSASVFDALVAENGGRMFSGEESAEKSRHVAAATGEIRNILDTLRFGQERECVDFRRLLGERQLVLRQYAKQRLLNKRVADERAQLQQNQRELTRVAKQRFADEGPEKQRRAELAIHSMDVLEQTAVGVLDPESFPKRELRSGDACLAALLPEVPEQRVLDPNVAGFYSRLFDAVADDKSTAYVASQEYEFTAAARQQPIMYIYTSDPGPFITGEAKPRVSPLIGHAFNVSGAELQPVVSQLSGEPDSG